MTKSFKLVNSKKNTGSYNVSPTNFLKINIVSKF